jgi:hypothetical protein
MKKRMEGARSVECGAAPVRCILSRPDIVLKIRSSRDEVVKRAMVSIYQQVQPYIASLAILVSGPT